MFNKARDFIGNTGQKANLARQMMGIQKQLAKEKVVLEENGVRVVITGGLIPGSMKIKELEFEAENERYLIDVLNKAIKKAQEKSLKKMQELGSGMGMGV